METPKAGLVVLAVPDDALRQAAERLAGLKPGRRVAVVHVSGALGLDVLSALSDNAVGSFHPLQSFPEPRGPAAFRGSTVAVDSTSPALRRRLERLARDLGATPKHVGDEQRVLYHAAAVFASNYLDVVIGQAIRLLQSSGWNEAEATAALVPLAAGALENLRRRGPVAALTGPVRRGDAETVEKHLAALEAVDRAHAAGRGPKTAAVYRMLGSIALEYAKDAGLKPAAAGRTRRALTPKKAATRRRRRT
ncbi:MAG TPA: DUF2520 domain-containing protein [Candidatus Sulfotelmatobacter sp.]|nr:DUF2520 domain-containing protein [Candidatus Sulfotelmatobacter sp.]